MDSRWSSTKNSLLRQEVTTVFREYMQLQEEPVDLPAVPNEPQLRTVGSLNVFSC
ncbi:hypothetical protein [Thaumasiovibrio sp. DFM-14]|uniref:hypothetical protein n=1 Tax=Thaumasiovibrio sp. DFM-14 TaxID=3384792 RepID=UPI0039A33BBC